MSTRTAFSIYQETWNARKFGPAEIKELQLNRLNDLVRYARQQSRFYAELYRDLPESVSDIRQLPVVSKASLMPRFSDWVTDPAIRKEELDGFLSDLNNIGHSFMGKYTVCTTSGTTGQPAIFLQDQQTMALMGALNILRAMPAWITGKQLMKIIGAGMKTAAVWATGGHFLGITMMKRQILEKPSRARAMKIFSVVSPLPEIVDGLNRFKPAMLNGYATAISLLAQEQEAGRLHIQPVLVMTSSESLSEEERERIRRVFGCTIADNYGCSEFVAMAAGCKHGWLHLNSDWVILEPVDENLNPVQPGQPSHTVLLTNLINQVQPILRYNLGDRVTLNPDPCPCGNPRTAFRVEGRTDDVLRLAAVDGSLVPVLPLALYSVIKQVHNVQRFQVIQTGPACLKIRLETSPECDRANVWNEVKQNLLEFLTRQGLPQAQVQLAEEWPVRDPRSGKFRHVWAELPRS